ncbi:hypothetical protein B296_00001670 [Ensete ventricosum]|uniref:Uncharacterized protein n=1 Tax=Ensete ventricosum TaxID=4639 RepID=A0A427ARP7_ENSVE|nr:hypothetical protein B296_00001670 [Ensete ventricosum]
MPSPVDAKSLRDLKVMKSCHDVASVMTEESLGLIRARIASWNAFDGGGFLKVMWRPTRGVTLLRFSVSAEVQALFPLFFSCYLTAWRGGGALLFDSLGWFQGAMDLDTLRRKPRMSSGKTFSVARAASSPPEVEEVRVEAMSKRLAGRSRDASSVAEPDLLDENLGQLPSGLGVREGSPAPEPGKGALHLAFQSPYGPSHQANLLVSHVSTFTVFALVRPYSIPSRLAGAPLSNGPIDRVHDADRLVTIMGNRASHMEEEIKKLKSEGDLEQLATTQ